jgi:predicted flap endonuclease-1-like 5' DNA nuclease
MGTEVKEAGGENEPEAAVHSTPPASGSGNFTRFGSGAPLVPPRPSPSSQGPSRPPPSIPRAPTLPSTNGAAVSVSQLTVEAPEKKDNGLQVLEEQLDAGRRALASKDAEVRALLAQRDAGIAEIRQLRNELSVREHQIELRKIRIKDLERAAEQHAAKCVDLEAQLQSLRQQRVGHVGDDLKLIRGIGPAFERELKRLGVRTFSQIAAWSDDDIDQIGPQIKARPERIKRDGWVKRARELADGHE